MVVYWGGRLQLIPPCPDIREKSAFPSSVHYLYEEFAVKLGKYIDLTHDSRLQVASVLTTILAVG